jgi:hypothetical protein
MSATATTEGEGEAGRVVCPRASDGMDDDDEMRVCGSVFNSL